MDLSLLQQPHLAVTALPQLHSSDKDTATVATSWSTDDEQDNDDDNENCSLDLLAEENNNNNVFFHNSCSSLLTTTTTSHACSLKKPKRRVSWNGSIQVQEYAVTLGQHPCNRDGLALELDWPHTVATERPLEDNNNNCDVPKNVRNAKYQLPRRLSFWERCDKLRNVSVSSIHGNGDGQVNEEQRNAQLEHVIRLLQDSWQQQSKLLPMPDLVELEEEEEADNDDETETEQKTTQLSSSRDRCRSSSRFLHNSRDRSTLASRSRLSSSSSRRIYAAPKPMAMEWKRHSSPTRPREGKRRDNA